jgi:ABC-type uncharacterized transport system permease subunit
MTKGFSQAAGIDTMGFNMINVQRVATAVAGLGLKLAGAVKSPVSAGAWWIERSHRAAEIAAAADMR